MSTPIRPDPSDTPGDGATRPAAGVASIGASTPSASRAEYAAFLDDLAEIARTSAPGDMRRELEERVAQARRRVVALYDSGVDLAADARDRAQRGLLASREAIADRPLSSVAIAALAGLLVGLLLNRRR